jgi:hypothetical protein
MFNGFYRQTKGLLGLIPKVCGCGSLPRLLIKVTKKPYPVVACLNISNPRGTARRIGAVSDSQLSAARVMPDECLLKYRLLSADM